MASEAIDQFVDDLKRLRVEAGNPSLRDLERLTLKHASRLPHTSAGDLLRGTRPPTAKAVIALVIACREHAKELGFTLPDARVDIAAWQARLRGLAVPDGDLTGDGIGENAIVNELTVADAGTGSAMSQMLTDAAEPCRGPLIVEITRPDGTVVAADVLNAADVPDADVNLSGNYIIEEIEERIRVDETRTASLVFNSRTIRATRPGVQDFLYAVEGPPGALHRLVIGPVGPVTVTKVIRVGENSHVVHLHLPAPLAIGERYTLRFSLLTNEDYDSSDPGVYGKRQFVTTKRIYLAIEFAMEFQPVRVRWFASSFPIGAFPDGYTFPENTDLPRLPTGIYEKEFDGTAAARDRIVGLVWDYA